MSTVFMSCLVGLVFLILYLIAVKLTQFVKWHRRMVKILSHFPGPKSHWFFGNALQIGCFHDFISRMHDQYVEKQHSKGYSFWIFRVQPVLYLTHPDTIKVVMKSNAPKARGNIGYHFMVPWIGDSLLVTHGPKWERNRRLLTPAFHFSVLNGYFKIYNNVADTLMDKLATGSKNGGYIEVYQASALAVLDNLLQCSLSYQGNIQLAGDNHPYVNAVKRLVELVMSRNLNILHYPEYMYKFSANGREFFSLCAYVHKFAEEIIEKRKKQLFQENVGGHAKRQLDFLDILLTAKDDNGNGLTDEEIRSEVDTFMFAGHETTASVLSWSLYSLGKHKDVQEKVYQEVKKVIGDKQYIDGDDITEMKYLSCFLKEVMRHHTPVPLIARTLDKPMTVNGAELPEGLLVILGIHSAHHHPDVWDNPWDFRPERFVGERNDKDPYSFTPFSAGPRNCIGQSFAQSEEKVIIARIINRFEISLDPTHKVEHFMEFVMRAKAGIMVNFKERR